jgi:hypothetical protein
MASTINFSVFSTYCTCLSRLINLIPFSFISNCIYEYMIEQKLQSRCRNNYILIVIFLHLFLTQFLFLMPTFEISVKNREERGNKEEL